MYILVKILGENKRGEKRNEEERDFGEKARVSPIAS
jgi:hypothetical protein